MAEPVAVEPEPVAAVEVEPEPAPVLPAPPPHLVSIAESRRSTERRRLAVEVERIDRDTISRTERIRASSGSMAEVQRVGEQMRQARGERIRRLDAIDAMGPRDLVREYVKESGWSG